MRDTAQSGKWMIGHNWRHVKTRSFPISPFHQVRGGFLECGYDSLRFFATFPGSACETDGLCLAWMKWLTKHITNGMKQYDNTLAFNRKNGYGYTPSVHSLRLLGWVRLLIPMMLWHRVCSSRDRIVWKPSIEWNDHERNRMCQKATRFRCIVGKGSENRPQHNWIPHYFWLSSFYQIRSTPSVVASLHRAFLWTARWESVRRFTHSIDRAPWVSCPQSET